MVAYMLRTGYRRQGKKSKRDNSTSGKENKKVNRLLPFAASYLTLDVYSLECFSTKLLKVWCNISNLHAELLIIFSFDYVFGAVRFEEFTTCLIVFEAKFVSEETQSNLSISANELAITTPETMTCPTYPLAILARALRRSRSMNMSIR